MIASPPLYPGVRTLRAAHYRTGTPWEFLFNNGRLVSRRRLIDSTDLVFGPGFFDLQCNGYAGVDFAHPATTPPQIASAIRAMWKRGCTHVLPTLITASPDRLALLFSHLVEALKADRQASGCVPGFHLEGPFISPLDGARGAHPKEHVIAPVQRVWRRVQKAAQGKIRLVTLAPETKRALPFIRERKYEGIVVALGHTMADRQQIAEAVRAGAVLSTHLGNGCPQQMHRHLNPVYAQLGEDSLSASMIADGIHLPSEVLRSFYRVKGAGRTILVTDSMAAADAPPGRYTLGDLLVDVGPEKVVRQSGTANLAGSALTIDSAVFNFMAATGASLAEAWDAASVRPWKLMGRNKPPAGSLCIARPGPSEIEVVATISANRLLFLRQPL